MSRLQTLLIDTRSKLQQLGPFAPWLWLAAFALLVSFAYTSPTPERAHAAQPEAHGDGLYYYAYLRSIAFDHDVDFRNDYHLLGDQFHAGINPITHRPQNVFTVGPALFWMPLVPVARAAQHVSEWFGAPHQELNGVEPSFQRIVLFGSTLAGLVATGLVLLLALRIAGPSLATMTALGLCIGSPLIWFMLRQPSFSHATDACAVALFVSAWLTRYGSRTLWQWVAIGALLGLAMMVRPQNIAHVMLPLAEWLIVAIELARARDSKALARWVGVGFAFVAAVLLAFSPLLLIWKSIYGEWTLVPQGANFMHWTDSRWSATLFASRSGLFAWHPLLLLSMVGLGVLACSRRYARELRILAGLAIVILFTQSYINGAALDWWGGWAFGGRRFMSCFIYFGVGLATVVEGMRRVIVARPERFAKLCIAGMLAGFALYNRSLADDYLRGHALPDGAQPMKPRIEDAFTKTIDELYSWVGNPGSWPANLLFAWRAHISPERYDVAAASDLFEHHAGAVIPFDDGHAMGGFEPHSSSYQGHDCRIARERELVWVFTLRRQIGLRALINVVASEPGTRIRMTIGGRQVFDRQVGTEFADYTFEIPEEESHPGVFFVDVEQTLPKKGAFVCWDHGFFAFQNPPLDD